MAPLDDSPRHATPRSQRASWDPRPLLADLKAGVQAQLARTESPETDLAGDATVSQPTVDAGMSDPAGGEHARVGGSAMVHAPSSAESKDRKHLRRAAEAAEAAAAQAAGAASQAAITAERARSDARVAREEAAAAHAAAGSVVGELSAAREEVTVLHQALEHVQARARRDVLIAWVTAGVALVVAVAGLVTG
ncbi:hypothetical protein [Myceligenerans xiligouense]|uniref:Uncharacterized protein n=1 Tax=Myceligenerans xiligouense TaxID=253184 RepID=A0A3N4ZKG8_9MICO|nr:hypothetical protein [Myceligenerans xiligouense]RPF21425.1 hypothetical protein EDD34_2052 [Myceligenerans xiligouense]